MNTSKFLSSAILLIMCLSVFVLQPYNVGFEPGHRGWVSSHGLAIAAHSKPENGFVGYALKLIDEDGNRSYSYFTRFPFCFTAITQQLLTVENPTLPEQVFRVRQMMNIIYASTLITIFLLLLVLGLGNWEALTVTAFVGSGYYLVWYKDLSFYDPPALLGIALFWLCLALYRRRKQLSWLVAGSVFAVCFSQSGAIFASFFIWALWETIPLLIRFRAEGRINAYALLKQNSIVVSSICLILFISLTFYNIVWDATLQGVSLLETSIVKSFTDRVYNNLYNYDEVVGWSKFTDLQLRRLGRGLLPFPLGAKSGELHLALTSIAVGILIATPLLLYRYFRKLAYAKRELLVIMLLSGPLWIFSLRGFTAFHDYSTFYYLGFYIVFALLIVVNVPRLKMPLCTACLCLFFTSHYQCAQKITESAEKHNMETHDMEIISQTLPEGVPVSVEEGYRNLIRGAPYVLGFYLPQNPILKEGRTKFVISRGAVAGYKLLTPNNQIIFLSKKQTTL